MTLSPKLIASFFAGAVLLCAQAQAQETDQAWLPTLITETPAEGFDLAISMARKAVTTTQTEIETLQKLRPAYSHDPDSLIQVSGVVAHYFQIVAEANGYWRD